MMHLRMASRYKHRRRREILQEFISMQQAGVVLFGGLGFLISRKMDLEGLTPDWPIQVMTGRAELPAHAMHDAWCHGEAGPSA